MSQFSVLVDQHAEYAYPVHEIESVEDCAQLCQNIPECLAFDYDRNLPPFKNSRCWIHDVAGRPIIEVEGVDHYKKQPCL